MDEQLTKKKDEVYMLHGQIHNNNVKISTDKALIAQMNADCRNLADDNIFLQEEIAHLERERKYAQDSCKTIMKSINKEHKDFKKLEHSNQAVVDLNKELETKIGGTEKLIEELI